MNKEDEASREAVHSGLLTQPVAAKGHKDQQLGPNGKAANETGGLFLGGARARELKSRSRLGAERSRWGGANPPFLCDRIMCSLWLKVEKCVRAPVQVYLYGSGAQLLLKHKCAMATLTQQDIQALIEAAVKGAMEASGGSSEVAEVEMEEEEVSQERG